MNDRIRPACRLACAAFRSLASRLSPLWPWLRAQLRSRRIRLAGYAAGVICLALLVSLAAYAEYRTNLAARAMGRFMAATNGLRRPGGTVGARIVAQDAIGASLDVRTAEWSGSEGSLPQAVAAARFEVDRDMPGGLPRSLDIYRVPLTDANRRRREGPEVLRSLSAYRLGLQIMHSAWLPDARYARRVADEIETIYRASAPPQPVIADTLRTAEAAQQDSLDAALRSRLAGDLIAPLRERDRTKLTADFQAGLIYRIRLNWGLGRYEGEVQYDDPTTPRVAFELSLTDLAQALDNPNTP